MSSPPLSDLDPLLQALDDLLTGLHAINHQPPVAWPAVGPLGGTARDGGPLLHCVLCGQPISELYRRGPAPAAPAAHWDRGTCLTTITYIARFVLEIFSDSEPRPDGNLPF